jgi:hypothetical protein
MYDVQVARDMWAIDEAHLDLLAHSGWNRKDGMRC